MTNTKPGYYDTEGYGCFDLTECRMHRLANKDGSERFVLVYPKKWEEQGPIERPTKSGETVTLIPYWVTEWEEVQVNVKPYEGK